jgi:hypothetical protein
MIHSNRRPLQPKSCFKEKRENYRYPTCDQFKTPHPFFGKIQAPLEKVGHDDAGKINLPVQGDSHRKGGGTHE